MITDNEVERVPGATVYGSDGEKIGRAGAVYRDDQSGRPDWVTVQTGLFGTSESFVPLAEASFDGDDLRVPYDKARVKDAPRVDAEGHLDISEEDRLFEHYGVSGGQGGQDQRDQQDQWASTVPGRAGDPRDDVRDEGWDDPRGDQRGDRRDEQRAAAAGAAGAAAARHRDDDGRGPADGRRDERDERRDGDGPRLRDADDRGLWRSGDARGTSRTTDRPADRTADRTADRGEPAAADEQRSSAAPAVAGLGLVAAAAGSRRDEDRDDTRDDRDRSPSGLSSSPVAAAADGRTAGSGERRPRLSQWVLVERSSIIEVSEEEAVRLAASRDSSSQDSSSQR